MRRIAVGITGASGSVYAKVLLDKLSMLDPAPEVAVVMSENAKTVWRHELGNDNYSNYPFRFYERRDFSAPFASGSSAFDSLIIIPCSMGTLGRISAGTSDDLITRAADVMLKERRQLILVPRDTPLNLIQLRNMVTVTEAGGIICPAMPSFYSRPTDFTTLASTVVDRVLALAGVAVSSYRWGDPT
jgi:4-hydroxy-3-polyprenylbenzoate decarboxylase